MSGGGIRRPAQRRCREGGRFNHSPVSSPFSPTSLVWLANGVYKSRRSSESGKEDALVTELQRRNPAHPLVGVGAVVLHGGRVLLVRRANPPRAGEWSLPGGLQHLGETVAQAAFREVKEETGIDIRVLGVVDVVDLIEYDDAGAEVSYHFTLVELLAIWQQGEVTAGEDAADAAWVELDRLASMQMWAETIRIIHLAHKVWADAGRP
jgi:8-oxo-dGTP diphosphatase